MSIVHHPDWDLSSRGKKDAERHHDKIDDAIRKNVKDVIAEESIITQKRGKKVRIPVKGLKDYRFVYGSNKKKKGKGDGEGEGGGEGVGQGKGKPGDVIGRRPKPGDGKQGKGKPGNKPGEDYIEAEVDIDYLIQVMFEDLGLPWIEEKTKASQLVPSGWKFETISKVGILPRIHKKRTMLEAIKRNQLFASEISEATGRSIDDSLQALTQAKGDINKAIELIKTNKLDTTIDPYIVLEDEDIRYKQIEEDYELHSNAVVIAMMDTSGSMTPDKKYLCRSLLFWLVEFLKKVYDHVEIKFVTHTTDAKIVDEDTFFHKGECHTEGHYVLMGNGSLKDIKDIKIGDEVISIDSEGNREIKPVTRVYAKDVRTTLELDINGAGKLRCTPNHRYFVFDINNDCVVEKKAIDIDINTDYLLMPISLVDELNDSADEMLNYIIGFILGDGYVKDRSISITDKDIDNLKYIQSILNDLNISNNIICDVRNRLWIYNKNLCDYIRDNYSGCCKLSPARYIDEAIFNLDHKNLGLFISGLFDAEGHVSKKSIQIILSSKKLIKQLYNLLLKFGILSSYTYIKPSAKSFGYEDGKVYYKLQIQGDNLIKFEQYIGFRSCQKKEALKKLTDHRKAKDTKTRSPLILLDKPIYKYVNYNTSSLTGYDYFRYIPHRYYMNRVLPRKYIEKLLDNTKLYNIEDLLKIYSKAFILRTINSIEVKKDTVTVHDITIKDNSSYVIDGVYSHNSGGTYCWSAIDKAIHLIDTEFPVNEWNVYCVYVSDGDDFKPDKTITYIEELLKRNINMFSYNEVNPSAIDEEMLAKLSSKAVSAWGLLWSSSNTLIQEIKKHWKFVCKEENGAQFCKNEKLHFLTATIKDKSHIYPTLKHILFKKK